VECRVERRSAALDELDSARSALRLRAIAGAGARRNGSGAMAGKAFKMHNKITI